MTGFYFGSIFGEAGNYLRECLDPSQKDHSADLIIGQKGSQMGASFYKNEYSVKIPYSIFGIPITSHYDWQHSFHKLFEVYMPLEK